MSRYLSILLLCFIALVGCNESTTVIAPEQSNAVDVASLDTLRGAVHGTMEAGGTWVIADDIFVPAGDTLRVGPGVKLIILGPAPSRSGVLSLFVRGALIVEGARDSMVEIGPPADRHFAGAWGGIQCDSPSVVSLKWCRIDYGAGLRPDGRPKPAIYFFSNAANTSRFILEDCVLYKPKDDGFLVFGGSGRIVRNSFLFCGQVEGSGPNFKNGFSGEVAYNYIWSTCDQSIRVETGVTALYPQTDLVIHNNTIINSGHKNPSRPGAAIKIDKFARARVYNNIFVNTRIGLYITRDADTLHTSYGNNLFYTTVDSLRQFYYPLDGRGHPQPSDLINVDPRFVRYDPDITAAADRNDLHLQSDSPALGAGNPEYDPDLGAFTAHRDN